MSDAQRGGTAVASAAAETPRAARRPRRGALIAVGVSLAVAMLVAALWWWLPLEDPPTIAELLAEAQRLSASPLAPLLALACFVVGGLVVFPINLLIAASVVVFGPIAGAAYAALGSVLSAAMLHAVGRRLPASLTARVLGVRGERLRRRIAGHGTVAMAVIRLLPIAPFSVVSLVAGAARIPWRGYLFGTLLGMLPGIVVYALFVDRALAVIVDPHPLAWLGLVGAIVLMVGAGAGLRGWQRRVAGRERPPP